MLLPDSDPIREKQCKAGIPRRRHQHRYGHPQLADTSDARFPEVIPMESSTTRRYSREDVGEEVRVGVGVGVVECQLNLPGDGNQ